VHSGIDMTSGQPVAIKVIELERLSKKDIASIQSEVAILKGVAHPNIVRLVSSCFDTNYAYIITELVEGGELFDSIITREYYSEADAQVVLRDLASALEYCHSRKIVHRDLKPENILLSSKGDDAIIKLIDFGFAKRSEGDETMLTTALGTPNYIAPEILNRQPYNEAVDMWAYGCVFSPRRACARFFLLRTRAAPGTHRSFTWQRDCVRALVRLPAFPRREPRRIVQED